MGPPTAVPLRDVSCVMILLHLYSSIPPSLCLFPSGANFWQDFKTCWRNMEQCIRKCGKKLVRERARTRRGVLQGAVGSGQVHFLAPCGCLTSRLSRLHVLFIIYATVCLSSPLPTTHPRRTESGGASTMPTLLHC